MAEAGSRRTACAHASVPVADVAIVHDYLTQRGGAERVVLSMLAAFPGAPLYTALYEPDATFPEFADHDVRPLATNRLGLLRADHRRGLPVYPLAFSATTVDADVTLCSSSGFAHGVRTTGHKVVYCYTPARWLYDEAPTYLAAWPAPVRSVTRAAGPALRAWDRRAARSADAVLTSSSAVRDRIARHYGIDAAVLAPPVPVNVDGPQRPVPGVEPGFVLSVGRLLAYKHVDAAVAAMAQLPEHRLVVAGDGPERSRLEAMAGANVCFAGQVDDAQLRWLYQHCAGLVSASFEDFGLTPIEAAAHGKPAAVLRRGGFLDTVVDGETGVFFDTTASGDVAAGIRALLERSWPATTLRDHATRYHPDAFTRALRTTVIGSMSAHSADPGPPAGVRMGAGGG